MDTFYQLNTVGVLRQYFFEICVNLFPGFRVLGMEGALLRDFFPTTMKVFTPFSYLLVTGEEQEV